MKKNKPARKVHKRRIEKSTQIVIKRDWFPTGADFDGLLRGNVKICYRGMRASKRLSQPSPVPS